MIPAFVTAMRPVHVVPGIRRNGCRPGHNPGAGGLLDAVAVLDREGYLLEDVMASDLTEGFEIQYHFSLLDGPTRLVLRLTVPREAPDVPSISAIYPGANWHECECFDFYGIQLGTPICTICSCPRISRGIPGQGPPEARRSANELSTVKLKVQ